MIQPLHWYSGGAEVKTSHSTTAAIHVSVVLGGGGVRRWGRLGVDWGGSGKDSLVGFHATSQRTTRAREANSAASKPWKQKPTGRTQPSRCVNTPTNTPFTSLPPTYGSYFTLTPLIHHCLCLSFYHRFNDSEATVCYEFDFVIHTPRNE